MNWKVRLAGNSCDLEELVRPFTDPHISITKETDEFYLASEKFSACKTHEDVLQESVKLIKILNGAAKLALGSNTTIFEAGILKENEDGFKQFYMQVSDLISIQRNFSLEVTDQNGDVIEEIFPADEVPKWLSLGLKDESVSKVFRLFGNKLDWVNLYRIYEVIEMDMGGINAILSNDWISKSSIEKFKHTANNPGAIGDEARHGSQENLPPPKPMILSEACALIETLVRHWLRYKQ